MEAREIGMHSRAFLGRDSRASVNPSDSGRASKYVLIRSPRGEGVWIGLGIASIELNGALHSDVRGAA